MIKLALKNIIEKKAQIILAIISLAIASASLMLFMGLNAGIQNVTFDELEKSSPLNQITVRPPSEQNNVISFLGSDRKGISESELQEISQISGIKKIYPQAHFKTVSSVEISALGLNLASDSMVFGVEKGFIQSDLPTPEVWDYSEEPYPVILPSRILELYNLSIAPSQGLPNFNEDQLIGREITLFPNYSTFFPTLGNRSDKVRLQIAGFSDKVNLAGVTLPFELVEELNAQFENEELGYLEVYVETDDASLTTKVANQLEEQGYRTSYFQKNAQDVEAKLAYLSIVIGIISIIIFAITAIAIASTFLTRVTEKTKELGLFRALGASKSQIRQLIVIESLSIGLIGSIFGIAIALVAKIILSQLLLTQLEQFTSLEGNLISTAPVVIIQTIIFTTLLTILASYIPARKAANISPIEAIKN